MNKEDRKQLFIKNLKEKKNNEFELVGEFDKLRASTTFKHKVCGYVWDTQPHTLLRSKGTGCPKCQYRDKSKTTKEFSEEVFDSTKGEYSLVEGQKYINNREKLKFKHNECDTIFMLTPTSIFVNETSCPNCMKSRRKSKRKTTETFKKELLDKKGEDYILHEDSEYISALDKVRIIHVPCGNTWDVRASHILHSSGCPKCNLSKGETLVKRILEDIKVNYKTEYTFKDLKNTKNLPFDFAIISNNKVVGLIEYDGSQHFIPYKHFGGEEKLKKTQFNDRKKNKYCKDNNLPLKRLKYTLTENEVREEVQDFINSIIKSNAED